MYIIAPLLDFVLPEENFSFMNLTIRDGVSFPKAEPKKEEAVEQDDPLLSLMKNLQESEDSSDSDSQEEGAEDNAPDAPIAEYVTANELNALANQLISCWQIPIGAKNVHDMVVKVLSQQIGDFVKGKYICHYNVHLNRLMVDFDIKKFLVTYAGVEKWNNLRNFF